MLPAPVLGHRVLWYEGSRLLKAEGHPVAGELASADELPAAYQRLCDALQAQGVELEREPRRFSYSTVGFAGVGRLDTTANLACERGAEGLALLAGVAALNPGARYSVVTRRQRGGRALETVAWHAARGIVARAYDKGVESGLAARGELVRLEAQTRWSGASRRDIDELDAGELRGRFHKRFAPLWKASKGVKVVAQSKLAETIAQAVEEGRIRPDQAAVIAGHLVLESQGARFGSRMTRWRRDQLAREAGLVLADGVLYEVEIDLHDVLEEVLDSPHWGAEG